VTRWTSLPWPRLARGERASAGSFLRSIRGQPVRLVPPRGLGQRRCARPPTSVRSAPSMARTAGSIGMTRRVRASPSRSPPTHVRRPARGHARRCLAGSTSGSVFRVIGDTLIRAGDADSPVIVRAGHHGSIQASRRARSSLPCRSVGGALSPPWVRSYVDSAGRLGRRTHRCSTSWNGNERQNDAVARHNKWRSKGATKEGSKPNLTSGV
jgi:hypothetical protein